MTKLLDEAIAGLRQLPESIQDTVAAALIRQLAEERDPRDADLVDEER